MEYMWIHILCMWFGDNFEKVEGADFLFNFCRNGGYQGT